MRKRYTTPSAAFIAMGKGEGDVLSEIEFEETLKKLGCDVSNPLELFRCVDKDLSGQVTFDEFKSAMRAVGLPRVRSRSVVGKSSSSSQSKAQSSKGQTRTKSSKEDADSPRSQSQNSQASDSPRSRRRSSKGDDERRPSGSGAGGRRLSGQERRPSRDGGLRRSNTSKEEEGGPRRSKEDVSRQSSKESEKDVGRQSSKESMRRQSSDGRDVVPSKGKLPTTAEEEEVEGSESAGEN